MNAKTIECTTNLNDHIFDYFIDFKIPFHKLITKKLHITVKIIDSPSRNISFPKEICTQIIDIFKYVNTLKVQCDDYSWTSFTNEIKTPQFQNITQFIAFPKVFQDYIFIELNSYFQLSYFPKLTHFILTNPEPVLLYTLYEPILIPNTVKTIQWYGLCRINEIAAVPICFDSFNNNIEIIKFAFIFYHNFKYLNIGDFMVSFFNQCKDLLQLKTIDISITGILPYYYDGLFVINEKILFAIDDLMIYGK